MALVMRMSWAGVTPEQYAEVRRLCGEPLRDAADTSLDAEGTWCWTQVWQDHEAAEVFFAQSLLPAVAMARLRGGPDLVLEHERDDERDHEHGPVPVPEQRAAAPAHARA